MAINYTEKGNGLHAAIFAAGHRLELANNVWVSSDDVAVQSIIDAYDPLTYERAQAKLRIMSQIQAAADFIESSYASVEKQTWPYQRLEVEAYLADNNAPTPTLDAIAISAGITRADMLTRTIAKVVQFTAFSNSLVAARLSLHAQIDAETDWQVISQINYVG